MRFAERIGKYLLHLLLKKYICGVLLNTTMDWSEILKPKKINVAVSLVLLLLVLNSWPFMYAKDDFCHQKGVDCFTQYLRTTLFQCTSIGFQEEPIYDFQSEISDSRYHSRMCYPSSLAWLFVLIPLIYLFSSYTAYRYGLVITGDTDSKTAVLKLSLLTLSMLFLLHSLPFTRYGGLNEPLQTILLLALLPLGFIIEIVSFGTEALGRAGSILITLLFLSVLACIYVFYKKKEIHHAFFYALWTYIVMILIIAPILFEAGTIINGLF